MIHWRECCGRTLLQMPFSQDWRRSVHAASSSPSESSRLFRNLTLAAQIEKVAEAGYQGFEFGDWRAADSNQITKLKNKLGLECACIVGNRSVNPIGMGLCDPAEREGFLTELRASTEAAKRFETTRLVVLSGFKIPHLSRRDQRPASWRD